MKSRRGFCLRIVATIVTFLVAAAGLEAQDDHRTVPIGREKYHYSRVGNAKDVITKTSGGIALIGGGWVPDEAWMWLCNKSGGGDFLILTAMEDDGDSLRTIDRLCDENSIATLTIPSREAAGDPFVADAIRKAEVIFISGGLQGDYVKFWLGTPVQTAIDEQIKRGVPIAGASAGLAVLGEFGYTNAWATSEQTLRDPYNDRVTITHQFLNIPELTGMITDTHVVARHRLGRLFGFMARISEDGLSKSIRGIGVDEESAVLLEPDGSGVVTGRGNGAYFLKPTEAPTICKPGAPLTFGHIKVQRVAPGGYFNISSWAGPTTTKYEVNVEAGEVHSSVPPGY